MTSQPRSKGIPGDSSNGWRRTDYLICGLLIAVTLAIYWQAFGFGFITLDDRSYVHQNQHVLGGLSLESVKWAFTTFQQGNWHPLTWISLMVDAQLGHGSPWMFHAINVLLHLANALLLFVLLRWVTGFRWRAAAVAGLFAIHPLHVESVAWVAERKDVLSALFWLLTMLAYVHYTKQRTARSYLLTTAFFALGLMAKPMLVSLPLVLLLFDIWPLKRKDGWWTLIREKVPIFAMALASCVVTYLAQGAGGAISDAEACPFGVRAANALVSYVAYIGKMLCPLNLSVIYPHPDNTLPVWQVVGSALFFVAMLVVALRSVRKRPYITVGWLWYVLTLLPVIGLVQIGLQGMADRYTYVPLIGLFVILAMGIPELLGERGLVGKSSERPSSVMVMLGGVLLVGLAASSYYQVSYWRDTTSLYEHALAVDPNNSLAHLGLGGELSARGKTEEATREYVLALRSNPNLVEAHYNLGLALIRMNQFPEAVKHLTYAAKYMPKLADAQNSLGIALASMGRVTEAIGHFRQALAINPNDLNARNLMGCAYAQSGDHESAREQFEKVLKLDPGNVEARHNLEVSEAAAAAHGKTAK